MGWSSFDHSRTQSQEQPRSTKMSGVQHYTSTIYNMRCFELRQLPPRPDKAILFR